MTHEFFGMGAVLEPAREAVRFAAEGLRKAFGTLAAESAAQDNGGRGAPRSDAAVSAST
ncbi:MAG TPA: hypothetical protein VII52_05515 [Gemmatimonadaceae bacterium]